MAIVFVQLILEEFGKWVKPDSAATLAERDAFYALVLQALQTVWAADACPALTLMPFYTEG